MKFGTVMQIGPLQGTYRWNFEFSKIQDGGDRQLEKSQKSRYLRNGLTDLYEIWHANAKWSVNGSDRYKIWILQIQDGGRPPFWKNR